MRVIDLKIKCNSLAKNGFHLFVNDFFAKKTDATKKVFSARRKTQSGVKEKKISCHCPLLINICIFSPLQNAKLLGAHQNFFGQTLRNNFLIPIIKWWTQRVRIRTNAFYGAKPVLWIFERHDISRKKILETKIRLVLLSKKKLTCLSIHPTSTESTTWSKGRFNENLIAKRASEETFFAIKWSPKSTSPVSKSYYKKMI